MSRYVRPQIYATTPAKEVRQQLRRGVMPAPFVRRMRVINIISAITLRKIEDNSVLPFDVQDLHHILDKQISQDAIISMLDNSSLAIAIDSGDLGPLWESAKTMPLLRRGFDQSWIQRFMLAPFDPICMMLAMRAKLLLDAVDELGHSYNLLRALGMGWIDFGEIPGEEPGDPGSYVPPGIDQPIDYPDTIPPPGPGDPGYIPGLGDPGYIPPADLTPGDPGYTTTPESPGYTPPNEGMGGAGGIPDSPVPPITLEPGPGSPLSGGGPGTSRPAGGVNCCLSFDDPDVYVQIGYFTDHIDAGETLGLTVENEFEGCAGENYGWLIVSGPGELSAETGLDVIYTAPATGANCPGNAVIALICKGMIVDTLEIVINYDYAIEYDFETSAEEIAREDSELVYVIANNTPLRWSVSGTGFSLEHEETDGVGNVLHADETACGSATITVTGCDEQAAVGSVRCTTGRWSTAIEGCIIKGSATFVGGNRWEKIQGKHKQWHKIKIRSGLSNESCMDRDCYDGCGGACVECLDWKCSEYSAGWIDCGDWCCDASGGDCGPETHIGFCMMTDYVRYFVWIC